MAASDAYAVVDSSISCTVCNIASSIWGRRCAACLRFAHLSCARLSRCESPILCLGNALPVLALGIPAILWLWLTQNPRMPERLFKPSTRPTVIDMFWCVFPNPFALQLLRRWLTPSTTLSPLAMILASPSYGRSSVVFGVSTRDRDFSTSLAHIVRSNLLKFGSSFPTWTASSPTIPHVSNMSPTQSLRSHAHKKLSLGDVWAAIRIAAFDDTILDVTPEVLRALRLKHPGALLMPIFHQSREISMASPLARTMWQKYYGSSQ